MTQETTIHPSGRSIPMSRLRPVAARIQARAPWLLVLLPLVIAACNKSGGGTGY